MKLFALNVAFCFLSTANATAQFYPPPMLPPSPIFRPPPPILGQVHVFCMARDEGACAPNIPTTACYSQATYAANYCVAFGQRVVALVKTNARKGPVCGVGQFTLTCGY